MDLLMVFGSSFVLILFAYYCYWIFLQRAKLFDRAYALREDQLLKPQYPQTPRQFAETSRVPAASPFGVQIKLEHAD